MLFWFVGVTAFVPPPRQHANPILEIQRKHVKSFRPQQQRLFSLPIPAKFRHSPKQTLVRVLHYKR